MKFSRPNFLHLRMRLFMSVRFFFRIKVNVCSKTLGFLASIEILVSPSASPWLTFVRSQLEAKAFLTKIMKFSRPNFLHLRMRIYFSKIFFRIKVNVSSKTLGFLAPLRNPLFHLLAPPWLPFVRSQLEAKAFLTEIMEFLNHGVFKTEFSTFVHAFFISVGFFFE